MKSGRILDLNLTPAVGNDRSDAWETADRVSKSDLMWKTYPYQEAFFLSRLPSHLKVYDEDNNPLCFKEMLGSGLSEKELPVFIPGAGKVGVRLIMRPVPVDVYEKALVSTKNH